MASPASALFSPPSAGAPPNSSPAAGSSPSIMSGTSRPLSQASTLASERGGGGGGPPSLASSQATIRPATISSTGVGSMAGTPRSGSGLRTPSNRKTIYDRNLNRSRGAELSKASFAYLFGEMIMYAQKKVTGVQDFERRLADRGYPIGLRLTSLLTARSLPTTSSSSSSSSSSTTSSSPGHRQTRILPLLQFLSTHLWRALFQRQADSLRQAENRPNEYYLTDNEPLTSEFVSVPREMSMFNPGAFVAGVIEGACDGLGLPAKVSAVNGDSKMWPQQTVWVIAFEEAVVKREEALAKAEKEGKK